MAPKHNDNDLRFNPDPELHNTPQPEEDGTRPTGASLPCPPITLSTQRRTSTYAPTSGLDPYGHHGYTEKRQIVEEEMKDAWSHDDCLNPALIDGFFPEDPLDTRPGTILAGLSGFYGSRTLGRLSKAEKRRQRGTAQKGWQGIPIPAPKEDKITGKIVPIINKVIDLLHLSDTRVALDRQHFSVSTRDEHTLRPDIFVWKKGSPAFPPIEGMPETKAQKSNPDSKSKSKQKSKPNATQTEDQGNDDLLHMDWRWCLFPIEVKVESRRGADPKPYCQLGTYVREIFAAQENRKFVPSLLLTERHLQFLLWDRAGASVSYRLDYHVYAEDLCRILVSLLTWDDDRVGFDPSIFYRGNELHIQTMEPSSPVYVVEESLIRPYTLRGHATTLWRARKIGDQHPSHRYIIKDAWVKDGKSTEDSCLSKVEVHGILGIAHLIHIEDVCLSAAPPIKDTVNGNRRVRGFAVSTDLCHTRAILKSSGELLECFSTPKELLIVMHDAIEGHWNMYQQGEVLHRDIVPWNILLQREATAGSRGLLIDFSHAALNLPSIAPRSQKTPGAHVFESRRALRGTTTAYIDELESFYWILCYIVVLHKGPSLSATRTPPTDETNFLAKPEGAASMASSKRGNLLWSVFELPVQTWFGDSIQRLAANLHKFFHVRLQEENMGVSLSREAYDDHKEFIDYFIQAIKEIDMVEVDSKATVSSV